MKVMGCMWRVTTAATLLGGLCAPALASEPIIQTRFTADPAPMVYDGTVYLTCGGKADDGGLTDGAWHSLHALVSNANDHAITIEISLADSAECAVRKLSGQHRIEDGRHIMTVTVPANSSRVLRWDIRNAG